MNSKPNIYVNVSKYNPYDVLATQLTATRGVIQSSEFNNTESTDQLNIHSIS
jgi:hypothetical protein